MTSATTQELAVELGKLKEHLRMLETRTGKIEGDMASSWALQTKTQYEKEFKDRIKDDLNRYVVGLALSAFAILGGVGYFFMTSAVNDVYEKRNKQAIADLQRTYEGRLQLDQQRYEWSRFHNYGKDLVRVAEFYNYLPTPDDKRQELVENLLRKANDHFEAATRIDASQGSTYFELAELKYSYPINYKVPHLVDKKKAIQHYETAIPLYSEEERARGWKADAYLMLGTIYHSLAVSNPSEKATAMPSALENLSNAKKEFQTLVRNAPQRFKPADLNEKLNKVESLLSEIKSK
jgi:hypothetical protein